MTSIIETAPQGTATTAGARIHAREQHGKTTETMRFVPASSAPASLTKNVPEGTKLTWAETIAFGRYTVLTLARGTRVRISDTTGDGCVHTMLYRAGSMHERLNVADTVKVPWQAYPTVGHPLLSDAGRLMATIVADTSNHHDALTGATTLQGNTAKYGAGTAHSSSPAARELLSLGALKSGLDVKDVAPSLTFFKGIKVDPQGQIDFTGSAGPGASIELLLQMDTVIVLANTAHPLDSRQEFIGTAVDVVAWPASEDLESLEATLGQSLPPEHLQALHNTEHDLAARNAR